MPAVKTALVAALISIALSAAPAAAQGRIQASATILPRQGVEMGAGVATEVRNGALGVSVGIANTGTSSYVVQVARENDSAAPDASVVVRGGENREFRFRRPAADGPGRITYFISPMI
ncbi:MAG: hypothetical protein AVDCRST_MAG89-177 [uncultured Gemmatimonadetes bacterium]|uniref:Uncharacterized protein n=1 Tax=uncultured Gemmatimonadota bacterium TaxID=203437 RepID=A0A6J4K5F8_9BACT|nr:MAG: hypothetical protein AVDCRST_MAG89-177 [uncultured Gemmatimonadota bacterium]